MTETAFDINGVKFKLDLDPKVFSDEVLLGLVNRKALPEPEVLHVMQRVVQPGDTVIDGGANIGFFTCYLSRLVGPTGRVHAFEPYFINSIRLRANIDLNCMDNVIIHQEAISDRNGVTQFWPNKDNGQSSLWNPGGGTALDVITAALDEFDLRPTFIKLDIEGAETLAYAGGQVTLSVACVVAELNETALKGMGSSVQKLREHAMGLGQYTWVLPANGSHPHLVPITTGMRLKRGNTNVLFASVGEVARHWKEVQVD